MGGSWALRPLPISIELMHPTKSISAIVASIGGATAWAVIDGILGTLAALVAVVAGLLGLWWGWRTYKVRYEIAELERRRALLDLRARLDERDPDGPGDTDIQG